MTADQGFELHPGAAVDITDIWEFIAKTMPNNYRIDRVSRAPSVIARSPCDEASRASACAAPASPQGRTATPGLLRFARNGGQGERPSSCLLSFTVAVVLGSWPQFFAEVIHRFTLDVIAADKGLGLRTAGNTVIRT
jgi:hypothetical protein